MPALLTIENLSVDFISGKEIHPAVKQLSLEVNRGEIVALVGESGSGKSVTSMSILQLLPQPPAKYSSGKILFTEGEETIDLLRADAATIRKTRGNKIAMIFQEPMTSLNPVMRCGQQVMEALQAHKPLGNAAARKKTIEWFEKVKLPDPEQSFDKYPHQLSGGQKQRVMIAMAMCCQPSLLICDEPTTALDVTVQKAILQLIRELQQQHQMGVIFITHDLGVVSEVADRVAIMYQGSIAEEGKTEQIFQRPQHPYTKALIACRPSRHQKGERLPVVSDFLREEKPVEQKNTLNAFVPQASAEVLVRVSQLSIRFPTGRSLLGRTKQYFTAVDDVSFEVFRGETLGLVGESGCGKTTIGRTLLRLTEPSSGIISFRGQDISHLSKNQLKPFRQDVQLVFQDPYSSLNPRLTIGRAIMEPMKELDGMQQKTEKKKRAAALLEQVNLSPAMMNRYPHEFSGGQRQRIVIARALSMGPGFLVCDESVSALDVSVQAQVLNLLNELKKELGLTMLFISHDLSVVRYMCDRILVMHKGAIVESGPAEDVYLRPQSHYTKQLIDAIPSL